MTHAIILGAPLPFGSLWYLCLHLVCCRVDSWSQFERGFCGEVKTVHVMCKELKHRDFHSVQTLHTYSWGLKTGLKNRTKTTFSHEDLYDTLRHKKIHFGAHCNTHLWIICFNVRWQSSITGAKEGGVLSLYSRETVQPSKMVNSEYCHGGANCVQAEFSPAIQSWK